MLTTRKPEYEDEKEFVKNLVKYLNERLEDGKTIFGPNSTVNFEYEYRESLRHDLIPVHRTLVSTNFKIVIEGTVFSDDD